ncbi:hypothetical protein BH11PLA2_BH11PLA2_24500 [soil metagenome]
MTTHSLLKTMNGDVDHLAKILDGSKRVQTFILIWFLGMVNHDGNGGRNACNHFYLK